jgi:hypothetical protein
LPSMRPTNAVSTTPRIGSSSKDATAGIARFHILESRLFVSSCFLPLLFCMLARVFGSCREHARRQYACAYALLLFSTRQGCRKRACIRPTQKSALVTRSIFVLLNFRAALQQASIEMTAAHVSINHVRIAPSHRLNKKTSA